MIKTILYRALAGLFSAGLSYAGHVTTDSSLTMGYLTTALSSANTASNPWVMPDNCTSQPLWQLVPDPWAVNAGATGSIAMQYTGKGSIITTVNLSNLTSEGVNGFPFVFFGGDPYGDRISGQPVTFPAQLSAMSSLVTDISYVLSVTGAAPGDLDIGFDEWLIPSANFAGGPSGALEVMVLPYFNFSWAPAGHLVGTITQPVTVNGITTSMVFNEYSTGTGAGHEIIFFPRDRQISSGDVQFDLLNFLNIGAATGGIGSSWYVAGIEFGSEFGHTTTAKYTLTTTKILIEQNFVSGQ